MMLAKFRAAGLAIAAVFLGSGCTFAQVSYSINNLPLAPAATELLFEPGADNRLQLRLLTADAGPLRVSVELKSAYSPVIREERLLDASRPAADLSLGPMAAPPYFQFEAGAVFHRGYSLAIRIVDSKGNLVVSRNYHQGLGKNANPRKQGMCERDPAAQKVRFVLRDNPSEIYNPRYASLPPVSLRLSPAVLSDQDNVEIEARLNPGDTPEKTDALVRVLSPAGKTTWSKEVTLLRGTEWQRWPVDVRNWAPGRYRIELQVRTGGRLWTDGPTLTYRRHRPEPDSVSVSPFSPYKLQRDRSRSDVTLTEFPSQTHLNGFYAVFARFENAGGVIRIGRDGIERAVQLPELSHDLFVEAIDLTGKEILTPPGRDSRSTLTHIRLVPVTAYSAKRLYEAMRQPPLPMYAVNDWAEYFETWLPQNPDHFQSILAGQRELGFRTFGWSIGRSWVEYHSKLAAARTFPCVDWETAKKEKSFPKGYDYENRKVMMNKYDPLEHVLNARQRFGIAIWPWLGMQRHYTPTDYGGIFSCPFFRSHPEWWRVAKDGKREELSYFFPEVRRERIDILMEVAERGADGLLVGCDRQPPMALYEPEMVEQFRQKTGIDAMKIDGTNEVEYRKWIAYRADFFTQTLRDLQTRLTPLRARTGKRLPVAIRIPSSGIFLNLAEGLDVETWCREHLVDQIHLDPLEHFGGEGRHDVRPYLEIARKYNVKVIGGIGATAFQPFTPNTFGGLLPGLLRAKSLHEAGVDGIDSYETETLAWMKSTRFLMSLIGNTAALKQYLLDSNLDACYPVDAGNAAAGHDNHSNWRGGWSTKGSGRFKEEGFGYFSM